MNSRFEENYRLVSKMSETIEVIYEDGVFKPLRKVKVRTGEVLKIEIKETKKVTKKFYDDLSKLKKRVEKVNDAGKVLREMRNARY